MSLKSSLMQRCFDLARLGAGRTNPNPLVGAVLVHKDRIIGEGYHAYYGGAHAEVRAVASVKEADRPLITQSTLYVSLEPCNITGNTPPCTDLILREGIPRVIIAGHDQTPGVNGSGLVRLRKAGVEVEEHFMEETGTHLNHPRNVFVSQSRPYTLLKFAQTKDGFIASSDSQFWITNSYSRRLVHRWRAETDAILVGKRTALLDNPGLNLRYAKGKNPLRVVIDRDATLPTHLQLFNGQQDTWVFTTKPPADKVGVKYIPLDFSDPDWLGQLLQFFQQARISHLTVEGGAWLLQQFIDKEVWDEARVFTGDKYLKAGLAAPQLGVAAKQTLTIMNDELAVYQRGW